MEKQSPQATTPAVAIKRLFGAPPLDGRTVFRDFASLITFRGPRAENQDRAFVALIDRGIQPGIFLACVVDGMGGMLKGSEAADLAAGAFLAALLEWPDAPLEQQLEASIAAANAAVWTGLSGDGGATLTAIAIDDRGQAVCVHVGDSRLYAFDGAIVQVTTDDTMAGLLGGEEGDFMDPGLMQFVGRGEGMLHQRFDLSSRLPETMLLTTDGFHSLSWPNPTEMFDQGEAGFERLKARGDLRDNATCAFIDVEKARRAVREAEGGVQVTSTFHSTII